MNWPVGMGGLFEGVYDLVDPAIMKPGGDASRMYEGDRVAVDGLGDPTLEARLSPEALALLKEETELASACYAPFDVDAYRGGDLTRSEEHTSELQSLMRISYAVFCLKKKKQTHKQNSRP